MSLRVRVSVESFNYSACSLSHGDHFEMTSSGVTVPEGKEFCFFAVTNAVAAIQGHLFAETPDDYLLSEPLVMCPDTPEDLRMRVTLVPDPAAAGEPEEN